MSDNVLWLNKLVPKHVLLDEAEIESKLKPLHIDKLQLPKILLKDPALKALDQEVKPGDVVEVHRFSEHAGTNLAYRLVVEE
ncbi:MAG: DNA-directed RNA polymerase subunit H [Candidatus Thermoplasmatota archaeon]|nr:DNA-directed RNA polymerase subunit H [Candidatus Thermoplasmatota archaeon]